MKYGLPKYQRGMYGLVAGGTMAQQRTAPTTAEAITVVSSGLVMHLDAGDSASYPGTGATWYDLTSNNLDMTYNTGTPSFSSTDGGGSFNFAGGASTDVFDQADDPLTEMGETWSWCFWIKTADDISNQYVFSKLSNRLAILAGYQNGYVNAFVNAAYQPTAASTQIPITVDSWTFYCYSKDTNGGSDNWRGYVNDTEYFSLTQSFTVGNGTTFHIGNTGSGSGQYQGRVAIFMMYDRSLTAAEALQNYNATKTRFGL